jgi:hypothetical protein
MGLFGKLLDKFNSVNENTGLSFADRLGAAGGGWDPNQLRTFGQNRLEQVRLQQARDAYLKSIDQAYAPQYPQAASIDPSLEGSPNQPEQTPRPDPMQSIIPAILKAQGQGLDIGNPQVLMKMGMPDYETINGGDGTYGIVDKRTGQVQPGQLPNQYMDLLRQLKEAQVRAAEALAAQRQSASGLNNAKTKAGGFAPRQPRAGPKTLPPLPPGFVVSQ